MTNGSTTQGRGIRCSPIPRIGCATAAELGIHLDGQTRPFIATGRLGDWQAMREWTPEHFARSFGSLPVTANTDLPTEGAPYALAPTAHVLPTTMAKFISLMGSASKPCYLHQLSLTQFPALAEATDFDSLLPPGIDSHKLYVWVGSSGTRSGLHFDRYDNLNAQIHGRKRVFLVSPEQAGGLYPFIDNVEKSQVDPDGPDFARFPRLADVRMLSAVMEPGELLFIPRLWWHHLKSLEPAINVNCWYGEHIGLASILRVVQQGGLACWSRVARDFVFCGLLGMKPQARLFSEVPTGKFLFDLASGAIRRRLPGR